MAISVECKSCGRRFRAKDQFRGTHVKCPGCQQSLVIEGDAVSDHDVFISHSAKDKLVADAVVATLEAKHIRCWIAPRDIPPGATWGAVIVEAIEASKVMVLIYSGHANASQQVLREVERAVAKGVAILPLRIDAAAMSRDFEYFLSACHWLDAMTEPLEEYLRKLVSVVRELLREKETGGTSNTVFVGGAPVTTGVGSATVPGRPKRRIIVGAATGLVVVIAMVLAMVLNAGRSQPDGDPRTTTPGGQLSQATAAKSAAEIAWEKVNQLDRGQGFAQLLDEGATLARTAQTLFEQKSFADATTTFEQLQQQARRLDELERQRSAAVAARTAAQTAADVGKPLVDSDLSKSQTAVEAEQQMAHARTLFDGGEFTNAGTAWANARDRFERLAADARGREQVRLAAQRYDEALAAQVMDEAQMRQFGGPAWQKVAAALARAKAAGADYEKTAAAYVEAAGLVPDAAKASVPAYVAALLTQAEADPAPDSIAQALAALDAILNRDPLNPPATAALQLLGKRSPAWWIAQAKAQMALVREEDRPRIATRIGTSEAIAVNLAAGRATVLATAPSRTGDGLITKDVALGLARNGDVAGAIALVNSAITTGWFRSDALRAIVAVQVEGGDLAGAKATAETIVDGEVRVAALCHVAEAHHKAGDAAQARHLLAVAQQEALSVKAVDKIVYGYADLYATFTIIGDKAAADIALRKAQAAAKAYTFNPAQGDQVLVAAHARAGNLTEARALAATMKGGMDRGYAHMDLMRALCRAGKSAESEALISEMPNEVWVQLAHLALGTERATRGDITGAKKNLIRVVNRDGTIRLIRDIARAQAKAGDLDALASWIASLTDPEQIAFACCGAAEGLAEVGVAGQKKP